MDLDDAFPTTFDVLDEEQADFVHFLRYNLISYMRDLKTNLENTPLIDASDSQAMRCVQNATDAMINSYNWLKRAVAVSTPPLLEQTYETDLESSSSDTSMTLESDEPVLAPRAKRRKSPPSSKRRIKPEYIGLRRKKSSKRRRK